MNTENTSESATTPASPAADAQFLDAVEVRVLGVLAEKEAATPDNYPLSLNTLVNACNQLTSRDPVMSVTESEVLEAIDRLATKKLVNAIHQAGARVAKYEHRMRIKWMLDQPKVAVLTILMLRGFQTAGEIRARVGRLHEFASVADVEKSLDYLMDKYPPLVARLNLTPGTKEPRYAHLLSCDEASIDQAEASSFASAGGASKNDRVSQLETEVAQLKQQVSDLSAQFAEFKKQFE
ncbi:YceH family protein [Undibacterium sp. Ji42W]|uniref:YceH family protein n=1 Tax=Undibacterium sp. Ji42W TaxID=3413039 RepID=UPI003BF3C5A7